MSREKQNTPTNTPTQNQFTNSELKQIEEMVKVFAKVKPIEFPSGCRMYGRHIYSLKKFAETFFKEGYRKQIEVIRCKDCEYFKEYTDLHKNEVEKGDGDCHIRLMNTYLGNTQYCACEYDDFCSFAKMKGETKGFNFQKEGTAKKHFTPEDVRKMSQSEVRDNYQAIIQSMKKW